MGCDSHPCGENILGLPTELSKKDEKGSKMAVGGLRSGQSANPKMKIGKAKSGASRFAIIVKGQLFLFPKKRDPIAAKQENLTEDYFAGSVCFIFGSGLRLVQQIWSSQLLGLEVASKIYIWLQFIVIYISDIGPKL